jgi:hypothetical protein
VVAEIDRVIAAGACFGCVLGECRLWAQRAVPPSATLAKPNAPLIKAADRHYTAPPPKTIIDRVIFMPRTALDTLPAS